MLQGHTLPDAANAETSMKRPAEMGPGGGEKAVCNGDVVQNPRPSGKKRKMSGLAEEIAGERESTDGPNGPAGRTQADQEETNLAIEAPVLSWMRVPVEIEPQKRPDIHSVPGLDDALQEALTKGGVE